MRMCEDKGEENELVLTTSFLLSVKLLSLMFELARYSTSFMLQLVQMNASELLTYLLEKVHLMLCRYIRVRGVSYMQ